MDKSISALVGAADCRLLSDPKINTMYFILYIIKYQNFYYDSSKLVDYSKTTAWWVYAERVVFKSHHVEKNKIDFDPTHPWIHCPLQLVYMLLRDFFRYFAYQLNLKITVNK